MSAQGERRRRAKFRRARWRNLLLTAGPDRLTAGALSRRHAAHAIVVRDIEIEHPEWPAAFDGLRIGHVSDFHLGKLINLERAIEATQLLALRKPDLVACTGDVVDLRHDGAAPLFEELGALDAPLGAMLVLGNHDELHCGATVAQMARRAGLHVLEDEMIEVERDGARLRVAGIGWAPSVRGCQERVDRAAQGGADLLLAHNPRAFPRATELGIPLTLSGHTHGGQVALRNRPRASLALSHRHRMGHYERGGSHLYVTAGVGSWFPLRVNCPAEVAMITVRRSGS